METARIVIRPVELRDAGELQENCFATNSLEQIKATIQEELQKREEGYQLMLVAIVDGMVVGTAALIRSPLPLFRHRGEVAMLMVHPAYRGKGLAHRLIETCQSYACEMGLRILEINCRAGDETETIFRHLGFLEYGRLPDGICEPWGEQNCYDQVYFYQVIG